MVSLVGHVGSGGIGQGDGKRALLTRLADNGDDVGAFAALADADPRVLGSEAGRGLLRRLLARARGPRQQALHHPPDPEGRGRRHARRSRATIWPGGRPRAAPSRKRTVHFSVVLKPSSAFSATVGSEKLSGS